jgi:hypothetical protein
MSKAIREHIRSNVVGYVAIFMFATGGTAYGLNGTNTVDSGDIINNEVRSPDVRDDTLANGGLGAADLGPDSVGSSEVAPDSLDAADLNAASVGASEVSDESLGAGELAPDSVGNSEVATGAIGSGEVAADSVAAADLAPDSVGNSELAVDAVSTTEIIDGEVQNADLGSGAVTGVKVFPSSLSGADIAPGSLTGSDLAADTLTSSDIAAGAVGSSEVADESLGTAEFASSIPAARVTRTGAQGIPENSGTTLNLNSERYDTANLHTTSSPNFSRLTAPVSGIYEVSAGIEWETDTSGQRVLTLRKNGTTTLAFDTDAPVGLGIAGQTITTVARLAAGDYVEAVVLQISGQTLNIEKSNESTPEFSMTWLAPGP